MAENKKAKILHVFDVYPGSNTTNWLYNLITNIPACEIFIAAENYTKHNFYNTAFTYIDNPSSSLTQYKKKLKTWSAKLPAKIICYVTEKLLGGLGRQLEIELGKLSIDIAHAHFADVGCNYINVLKKKNLPVVVSFYGYDYEYLPYVIPAYKQKYMDLFLKADKFICEGTHGAKILLDMGCAKEKIEVVRLGVEVDKILFQNKDKKVDNLNLIQIASLREKKGHIYSIQAFHKVLIDCPNMHLTFVGSGDAEILKQLKQYIISNNLEKHISLLSEIDFSKLHTYLNQFDVFIHPSCYSVNRDCEGGAPIVLLDAQACGLPVISTTHCDIPDEVINYKTGLLTPEKDIDALSQSTKYFYKMENEEYRIFSQAARKHVEQNYSIKENALLLKRIYNNLKNRYEDTI